MLLIANTGDDEEQSLKEFTRMGVLKFKRIQTSLYKSRAMACVFLIRMQSGGKRRLPHFKSYAPFRLSVWRATSYGTRDAVKTDGQPILTALGASLPALRLPKGTVFSNRVKEATRGHLSAWKREFNAIFRSRACYLLKQTPNQTPASDKKNFEASFDKVKEAIPVGLHPILNDFIAAPSGWNPAAAALADCEWEQIKPLFDGVKREKFNLARETIQFFEDREPELISDDERDYLKNLVHRAGAEPIEDDAAFYESHRNELKEDTKISIEPGTVLFLESRERSKTFCLELVLRWNHCSIRETRVPSGGSRFAATVPQEKNSKS